MSCLVGRPAPDFTAPAALPGEVRSSPIRYVSLADYHDRWLIIVWYPQDFTFVCPTEIMAFSDRLNEFTDMDADVLAASTDSVYSHRAWAEIPTDANGIAGIKFPILADSTHQVARSFGVLFEEEGVALRGLFIVDPEGVVQYAVMHNQNVGRSVDETLTVLSAIQSGGLCGSDWKPGQHNLLSDIK